MQTLYELLGVSPDASADQITSAYYALARDYHPDKHAALPEAIRKLTEEKLKGINDARDILRVPARRLVYDQRLEWERATFHKKGLRTPDEHRALYEVKARQAARDTTADAIPPRQRKATEPSESRAGTETSQQPKTNSAPKTEPTAERPRAHTTTDDAKPTGATNSMASDPPQKRKSPSLMVAGVCGALVILYFVMNGLRSPVPDQTSPAARPSPAAVEAPKAANVPAQPSTTPSDVTPPTTNETGADATKPVDAPKPSDPEAVVPPAVSSPVPLAPTVESPTTASSEAPQASMLPTDPPRGLKVYEARDVDLPPKVLRRTDPPPTHGSSETLVVSVAVDADGQPVAVRVLKGVPNDADWQRDALGTVAHWTFTPAQRHGTVVPAWVNVGVNGEPVAHPPAASDAASAPTPIPVPTTPPATDANSAASAADADKPSTPPAVPPQQPEVAKPSPLGTTSPASSTPKPNQSSAVAPTDGSNILIGVFALAVLVLLVTIPVGLIVLIVLGVQGKVIVFYDGADVWRNLGAFAGLLASLMLVAKFGESGNPVVAAIGGAAFAVWSVWMLCIRHAIRQNGGVLVGTIVGILKLFAAIMVGFLLMRTLGAVARPRVGNAVGAVIGLGLVVWLTDSLINGERVMRLRAERAAA